MLGAPRPGAIVGSLDHDDLVAANPLEWLDEKFSRLPRGPPREPARRRADRAGDRASTPTARRRRCSRSSARRRSCSPPARRPPPSCCRASMKVLGDRPDIQQALRDDRSRIPVFVEESLRMDSPGEEPVPAGHEEHEGRRHRRARGHHADGLPRRGRTATRTGSRTRTSSPRPQERPRAHRVRPRRALLPRRTARPRRGPGVDRAHPRPDGRHHDRRGQARPGRRRAATTTSRRSSCAGSPRSTSSSRRRLKSRARSSSSRSPRVPGRR